MAEYIEKEALIAAYDAAHKGPPGGARKLMVDAPAADVEPVRHGRWTFDEVEMEYYCSMCDHNAPIGMGSYILHNYCPNCGARMDLED